MAKVTTRAKGTSGSSKYAPAYISIARPGSKPGKRATTKSLSQTVKIEAALDPELYATALLTKGVAQSGAEEYRDALGSLQASLDFHVKLYGAQHASIVDNHIHLAEVQRRMGDTESARASIDAAVARAREGKGVSSIQLGLALNELAALELLFNRLIRAYEAASESRRYLEEAGDPRRTLPMDTLARIHVARGEWDKARDLYTAMLEIDGATFLGQHHPRHIAHLHNLATVLVTLGESPAAAKAFKKVIEALRELYGDRYADLGAVYANLGRLEQSRKKFAEAEAHFIEARRITKDLLGKDHPFYGYDLVNLGRLALDRDDPKAAQRLLTEALAIYEKAFKREPHIYTASALTFLAYALFDLRKPQEAKARIEEALDLWNRIGALCADKAGDAGACDRAFAKVVLDCAEAACQSDGTAPLAVQSRESGVLDEKLQKGDIRRRLLGMLTKKGLLQKYAATSRTDGTLTESMAAAAP